MGVNLEPGARVSTGRKKIGIAGAKSGAHLTEDRRHQSIRATDRRHAAEAALVDALLVPHESPSESVGSEGQTLLTRALSRLERQEDVGAAVAWAAEPDGEPRILAAQPASSASKISPTIELYGALIKLDRVQRLTDSGVRTESPILAALAVRGVSAVAPVAGMGANPVAVVLLYSAKPGRPLRPRTVAVLNEVATSLSRSMSTNLALDRLGRLDDAVQQLDRLSSLGSLVSEIVHEIRNPLVSVKTFLQLLPKRLDDPEFHQDFRSVVNDEVQRLERMLDELLRHARPRPSADLEESARVEVAIYTTLQLMTYRCRERGILFNSEIQPELPALRMSEDSLRQLLLNLLLNAIQVTEEGRAISLCVDWSPTEANHVEFKVFDDGPGIDPAVASRIFEPFWTSRSRGEGAGGLGLAICKRIVDDAGGTIEVSNRREGGACFRVDLPIAN